MSKTLPVAIAIFLKDIDSRGAKLWVQERVEDGPLNGLLEFPGGKIEVGEDSEEAARREVLEEVDYKISKESPLPLFLIHPYDYKDRSICLYCHVGEADDLPYEKGQWLSLNFEDKSKELEGKIPAVNHIVIDKLLNHIKSQRDAGTWSLS